MLNPIRTDGAFTEVKRRPATFDIPGRTLAALRHMRENSDPKYGHVPYVGATLGEQDPHFVHHRLDWTEVLPYSVYGMVMARDIAGSDIGIEVQQEQRRLYLSQFNELDGLIHAPRSPWNEPYPMCLWEQARAIYALLYWYMDDPDERISGMIGHIVDGLYSLSQQQGPMRVFPVQTIRNIGMQRYALGSLIDPLTKVYEMMGNIRAWQLAEGLTYYMLEPRHGFFAEDGTFTSWYRSVVSAINGISRFAAVSSVPRLLARAKQLHDHALSLATAYGSTPCVEPACSNMELNMSALSLIHAGYDEYWDQIDRFTRNQTAQAQFLDPSEWVRSKARSGRFTDKEQWVYEGWPNDLPRLPYDDYENVVDRCVGGFLWTSADEHLFIPGAVMLCCCAHGVRSYHLVWREAVTEDIGGIRVNLHFNVENELAEIIAFEPYCGRTTVVPKKNAELSVRVPEFALGEGVSAFADGKPVDVRVDGRYAAFGPVIAGHEYTIEYDLHERETAEVQHYFKNRDLSAAEEQIAFTAKWTGNTVVSIEPSSREEKAIYRTRTIAPNDAEDRDGSIPTRDISYFLSAKNIRW